MQSQTKIFSQIVRDHMGPPPVILPADRRVGELLAEIDRMNADCGLVTAPPADRRAGELVGILTEHDIARRVALRCDGSEALADVMTEAPYYLRADDYLYHAIAAMRRRGLRHMPVVDRDTRPLGVIRLHDALEVAAEQRVAEIDRLCCSRDLDGLRQIKAAEVELAGSLLRDHVPATEISHLLSQINADIHGRILEGAIEDMAAAGLGRLPVKFCLIIMGSGGRGENFLYPDQDNGFILDDYPDARHDLVDGYFRELAQRFNRTLDAVGFPYCKGYVMARNPLWRKTRSQWRAQVALWGRRRSAIAIQLSDIFFDFRGSFGELQWANALRREVTEMIGERPGFLRGMAEEVTKARVALGWFGRFALEKEDPAHRGAINLKHRGTLPLVSSTRLLSLREGIEVTSTLGRLDALEAAGVLKHDVRDYLTGAFAHVTHLLLRQQLADFLDPERSVSNFVQPASLTEREKDMLVKSLKAIEDLSERVEVEFTGRVI